MRKKLALLLVLVLAVGMTACGKKQVADTEENVSEVIGQEDENGAGDKETEGEQVNGAPGNYFTGIDVSGEVEPGTDEDAEHMLDGDGSIAEPPLYIKLTSNTYETEASLSGETKFFQFYLVNGRLFLEVDDRMDGCGYCYSAMELFPQDSKALFEQKAGKQEFVALARTFSGFSYMGEYWDNGEDIKVILEGEELRIEDSESSTYIAYATENHESIHPAAKVMLEMTGEAYLPPESGLYGIWECIGEDGEEYIYEFGAEHTFSCMSKIPGRPVSYCMGAFISDKETGSIRTFTQRMGYGEMPADEEYEYHFEGDKLVLRALNYDVEVERTLTAVMTEESPSNMKAPEEEVYVPQMDYDE